MYKKMSDFIKHVSQKKYYANHRLVLATPALVVQIVYAVFLADVQFARVKLVIWAHHLVVDQNVLLVRNVIIV